MASFVVRVFLSSTCRDLEAERQVVETALQRMRETKFVGMEHFGTRSENTTDASLEEVDRSDLFVGVIGGRYGSGIVEKEYLRAKARGLPCFVYFKDPETIPDIWRDADGRKLEAFKDTLRQHTQGPPFFNVYDLAARVTADLHRWVVDKYLEPRLEQAVTGWLSRLDSEELLSSIKDLSAVGQDLIARLRKSAAVPSYASALEDRVIDFKPLIRSKTQAFEGRDWLFAEIVRSMNGRRRGYVRVIADAGLGKTAIAAEFARRYAAPAFFANERTGLTRAEQCLNHLAAEVILRFALANDRLPTDAGSNAPFLTKVLAEATAKAKTPVWVVVDALDEADHFDGHNALNLPDELPDGVFVLLTHRPASSDRALLTTAANTPIVTITLAASDDRQRDDIVAFLRRQAAEPSLARVLQDSVPPIDSEEFVTRMVRASEGNFMYLDYALQDLRDSTGPAAKLDTLPSGLAGYYERFWAEISKAKKEEAWTDWKGLFLPTICLLGAAGEPVTPEWLAALVERDPEEIQSRALDPWRRFLSDATTTNAWRIVHQSFGDFLGKREDVRAFRAHDRIATYFMKDAARWEQHDSYAARHLVTHLNRAGRFDDLAALIEDPKWDSYHRTRDPSRTSFVHDLDAGISAAEAIGGRALSKLVAWNCVRSASSSGATSVPLAAFSVLVACRKEGLALRYADLIDDGSRRASVHREMATAFARRGDTGKADVAFVAAIRALEKTWDGRRAEGLFDVARALAQFDGCRTARRALAIAVPAASSDAIESDPTSRARRACALSVCDPIEAWSSLRAALSEVGPLVPGTQSSPDVRGDLLRALARPNSEHPLQDRLSLLPSDYERSVLIQIVAEGRTSETVGDGLPGHLTSIHEATWWVVGAAAVLSALGERKGPEWVDGLVGDCRTRTTEIADVAERALAMGTLSQTLSKLRRYDEARAVALEGLRSLDLVSEHDLIEDAYKAIAAALADAGLIAELRQLQSTSGTRSHSLREAVDPHIVDALARAGELDLALSSVGTLASRRRLDVMSDIARHVAARADGTGLQRLLDSAVTVKLDDCVIDYQRWSGAQITVVDDHSWPRARAIQTIAEAMQQLADRTGLTAARRAAATVLEREPAHHVLAGVAAQFARLGDLDTADEIVSELLFTEDVPPDPECAVFLAALATFVHRTGNRADAEAMLVRAYQIAVSLEHRHLRQVTLPAVALACGDLQNVKITLAIVEPYEGPDDEQVFFAAVSSLTKLKALPELRRARDIASSVASPYWCARAVARVARALGEVGDNDAATAAISHAVSAVEAEIGVSPNVNGPAVLVDVLPVIERLADATTIRRAASSLLNVEKPEPRDDEDVDYHQRVAFAALARALANRGEEELSLQALARLSPEHRPDPAAAIAACLVRFKGLEQALAFVSANIEAGEHLPALAEIATECANRDDLGAVKEVLNRIDHPYYQAQVLLAAARAELRANLPRDAEHSIRAATAAARAVHQDDLPSAIAPVLDAVLSNARYPDLLQSCSEAIVAIGDSDTKIELLGKLVAAVDDSLSVSTLWSLVEDRLTELEEDERTSWRQELLEKMCAAVVGIARADDPPFLKWFARYLRGGGKKGRAEALERVRLALPILEKLNLVRALNADFGFLSRVLPSNRPLGLVRSDSPVGG